uniref:Ig-like domain-containing protein n=1 Tax=Chelonoidis abingdonii TaxID=106734 RepID=A0A8C0HAY6_CHEAB
MQFVSPPLTACLFMNPEGAQLPQTLHLPGPLGGAMTIRCRGQRRGPEFALYKAGARNAAAQGGDLAGVKFPIPKVSQADGGSYTCCYPTPDTRGGVCVSPSHPCLCVNAELPAPGPSISVSPSGVIAPGGVVTLRCRCRCEARRLFLYKGGIEIRELDAAGVRGELTIPIRRMRFVSPPLTACLFVTPEGSYPKPSISISPSGVIPMGGNFTIWCWHQLLDMSIQLYKAGDGNYLTYTDPAGSEAEFPITSARRDHGGSYTCRYSNRTDPPAYSEPSDPLIVAGEEPGSMYPLPAPHPAGLSGGLALVGRSEPGSALGPVEGTPSWGGVITVGVSSLPRQTLVLFPQGELTQPSQERPQFPPDQALWVQVLGLGGITIGPALKTGLRCLGAGAGMGTVNLVGGAQTSQGGAH